MKKHNACLWASIWVLAAAGCSSKGGTADLGLSGDGAGQDGLLTKDTAVADQATAAPDKSIVPAPKIKQVVPENGPANGGKLGYIPLTLVGENFAAGATVYVDGGAELITTVTITSSTSMTFKLPKNPYGAPNYDKPVKITLQVRVKEQSSNLADFVYTVSAAHDADHKGSVVTKTIDAFREFPSDPIEVKVFVKDTTDTATGDSGKIRAQVGLGKPGEDPTQDTTYRWIDAAFSKDDGGYDVFTAQPVPVLSQTYDVALRFSADKGMTWFYGDTTEEDGLFKAADAGKLTATDPPFGYCKSSDHCKNYKYEQTCKLDPNDAKKNLCVECLAEGDCKANPQSLGPKCDTAKNLCGCAESKDCAGNVNGKTCMQGYCGCGADTDCVAPAVCTKESSGLQVCQ